MPVFAFAADNEHFGNGFDVYRVIGGAGFGSKREGSWGYQASAIDAAGKGDWTGKATWANAADYRSGGCTLEG